MLVFVLLLIIIAISLNYFNLNAHHQSAEGHLHNSIGLYQDNEVNDMMSISTTTFWKRIAVVLLICTLPLLWEGRSYEDVYLYNGLLMISSKLNLVVGLLLITGLSLIVITSVRDYFGDSVFTSAQTTLSGQNERIVFTLCAMLGGIILSSATDFLTILLGLELQSYSVYILAASYRNYEPSEAAGLKYFLLGALSSALVFMGFAILYVYSGSTNLDTAFLMICSFIQGINELDPLNLSQQGDVILPYAGIILVLAGLSWKVAAAPVQAWSIDVYDAVPTRTTAILSLLPKIALFSLLLRLISLVTSNTNYNTVTHLSSLDRVVEIASSTGLQIIIVVIALSLIIGSIAGLFQPRIKRLLAYSSVLNVGFILMGSLLSNSTLDSYNPTLYIIQYIITTAAIWLCLINLANIHGNNYSSEITLVSQLQGIHSSPNNSQNSIIASPYNSTTILAICLTALVLSVAGIPPMVGFYAKYSVILLALQSGYPSLALIAVAASVISTVYYLGIIRAIWSRSSVPSNLSAQYQGYYANGSTSEYKVKLTDISRVSNAKHIGTIASMNNDYDVTKVYESTLFISFFSLIIVLYLLQYSVAYTLISL